MARLQVQLVDDSGRTIGYGDRWRTHRVKESPDGPILGKRHVGITIACVDGSGRILVVHRRHKIFDQVWTLSGDTHPYRMYGRLAVESLSQAAERCAMDDLGVGIANWTDSLVYTYSARDPRDPRYCENELLHVMVAKYNGPLHTNPKNASGLEWAGLSELAKESMQDLRKKPIDRKYAPWVHAMFASPMAEVRNAFGTL